MPARKLSFRRAARQENPVIDEAKVNELEKEFGEVSSRFLGGAVSGDSSKIWKRMRGDIERRFGLFKSDKIFIVATGMLKAGKSTLVNLLSRSPLASPIDFGVDTTLRPALIMAGRGTEKTGIYRYFPKTGDGSADSSSQGSRRHQLENIIDRISGLKDWDDEYRKAVPLELNKDNLRDVLCAPASGGLLPTEPLLVVVVVPDNGESLLSSHNCAIFDMPGLDSVNKEIDFAAYNKIFQECSLLLFVQSSVAPLNEEACRYLREIGSKLDDNTYRLVHNIMDTRQWRRKEIIAGDIDRQRSRGIQDFMGRLSPGKIRTLPVDSANLGKAYDAIFNPDDIDAAGGMTPEKLLSESEYLVFERNLRDDITQNGKDKHDRQCVKQLWNAFLDAENGIGDRIAALGGEIARMNDEIDALARRKNHILDYGTKFSGSSFIAGEFSISERLGRRIAENLADEFERLKKDEPFCRLMERASRGKQVRLESYNEFLGAFIRSAEDITGRLLCESCFDDAVCIVSSDGGGSERKSALHLMNGKISEMKSADSVTCNPILAFPAQSETVQGFLPDGGKLPMQRAERIRRKANPRWWNRGSDIVTSDSMNGDRDEIIRHYRKQASAALNRSIRGMMAEKLNAHARECLGPLAGETQKELDGALKARDAAAGDREAFRVLLGDLCAIEEKIGGILQ